MDNIKSERIGQKDFRLRELGKVHLRKRKVLRNRDWEGNFKNPFFTRD